MSKILLVTGGARSGKSTFAEQYIIDRFQKVAYIATAVPFDDEMKLRIAKHKAQRPSHWETFEQYKDLDQLAFEIAKGNEACLLDCLTIMVTNLMMDRESIDWYHPSPELVDELQKDILGAMEILLDQLETLDLTMVFVTNELGMGVVPENPMARAFRDLAGRVNQLVASRADEVYLLVCGLPMTIKSGNPEA